MSHWSSCKNILIIRPDNMGDLIMSGPAIRALKESGGCRITVLTSNMAAGIARMMPEIDEVMVFDLPWVKAQQTVPANALTEIVSQIREKKFDAAVVFTVYSQNPLPTVMLAFLAGIPKRLAYCRENPYELVTDWVPDKEPYEFIKHQVRRDLDLVKHVGATTVNEDLMLLENEEAKATLLQKMATEGIDIEKPFVLFHPGVSEKKREYPVDDWIKTGVAIAAAGHQILITGGPAEAALAEEIQKGVGKNSFSVAGKFSLAEFVNAIKKAVLVISVNTGTIHIAAAWKTPALVLYAFTNPQHYPWKTTGKVLLYRLEDQLKSKNEVIRYVHGLYDANLPAAVSPELIVSEAFAILSGTQSPIPEMPVLDALSVL